MKFFSYHSTLATGALTRTETEHPTYAAAKAAYKVSLKDRMLYEAGVYTTDAEGVEQ